MDVNPKDEFPIYPIAELFWSSVNNSLNALIFGSAHFAVEHPKSEMSVKRPRVFEVSQVLHIIIPCLRTAVADIPIRTAPLFNRIGKLILRVRPVIRLRVVVFIKVACNAAGRCRRMMMDLQSTLTIDAME